MRVTEQWRESIEKGEMPASVVKTYTSAIEADPGDARKAAFVISTDEEDRDGDTVSVKGWNLDSYRKNPVVLWAHDAKQPPIARAESIGVQDGKLKSVVLFPEKGVYPFADTIAGLVKGGFINGTSVGFHPLEAEPRAGKTKGVNFKRQELYEFSILPIPSNRNALREAKEAGFEIGYVVKWAEELLEYAEKDGLWVPKFLMQKALREVGPIIISVPAVPPAASVAKEGHAAAGAEALTSAEAEFLKGFEIELKGDAPGHPFRGNQFTAGEGGDSRYVGYSVRNQDLSEEFARAQPKQYVEQAKPGEQTKVDGETWTLYEDAKDKSRVWSNSKGQDKTDAQMVEHLRNADVSAVRVAEHMAESGRSYAQARMDVLGGKDRAATEAQAIPVPHKWWSGGVVKFVRPIPGKPGKYGVYSHTGKLLGEHDTEADAVNQLRAIEANKHSGKAAEVEMEKLADELFNEDGTFKSSPPWMAQPSDKPADAPAQDAAPAADAAPSGDAAKPAGDVKPADKGETPAPPSHGAAAGAGAAQLFQQLQSEVNPLMAGGDPTQIATALKAALEKFAASFMQAFAQNPALASPSQAPAQTPGPAATPAAPPPTPATQAAQAGAPASAPAGAPPAPPAQHPPFPPKKEADVLDAVLKALEDGSITEEDLRATIGPAVKKSFDAARMHLSGKLPD